MAIPHFSDLTGTQLTPFDTGSNQVFYEPFSKVCLFTEEHFNSIDNPGVLTVELGDRGVCFRYRPIRQRYPPTLMTTCRPGPSPSDSECRPASATTSWTILRSYGLIGFICSTSRVSSTLAIASRACLRRFSARCTRWLAMSKINRER